jgi:hypothetical protein
MDLNRLYFDHQATLIAADRTCSDDKRSAHLLSAAAIADHISKAQAGLGAEASAWWSTPGLPEVERHRGAWQCW